MRWNAITITIVAYIAIVGFRGYNERHSYTFPVIKHFPKMPQSESNLLTTDGVELGRYLFYDPILSKDSNLSCSGCHRQSAAFSDAPNIFSEGFNRLRQNRNTPPLFNLAWQPAFFWDGRVTSIEEQVFHPVRAHNEMNIDWNIVVLRINDSRFYKTKFNAVFGDLQIDSILIAKAIAQFERTLLSYRSKYDKVLNGETYFTKEEADGFEIVNDMSMGDCLHCHTTDENPLGTTFAFSNNGLDNASTINGYKDKGRGSITGQRSDVGKFKIPSLRNIALTAPYMHDGRFSTLEEVLNFYSDGVHNSINIDSKMTAAHRGGVHLSKDDKRKVITFLKTLTDSAFISDPAFSNPFKK